MYKCFHCGAEAVGWCSDADFEDIGREGEGVVHFLECGSCGEGGCQMGKLDIVVVDDRTNGVAASFDSLNEAREALARAGYEPVRYGGRESWTWRREVDGRAEYVHVDDREHHLEDLEACREAEAAGTTVDAYLQDGWSER